MQLRHTAATPVPSWMVMSSTNNPIYSNSTTKTPIQGSMILKPLSSTNTNRSLLEPFPMKTPLTQPVQDSHSSILEQDILLNDTLESSFDSALVLTDKDSLESLPSKSTLIESNSAITELDEPCRSASLLPTSRRRGSVFSPLTDSLPTTHSQPLVLDACNSLQPWMNEATFPNSAVSKHVEGFDIALWLNKYGIIKAMRGPPSFCIGDKQESPRLEQSDRGVDTNRVTLSSWQYHYLSNNGAVLHKPIMAFVHNDDLSRLLRVLKQVSDAESLTLATARLAIRWLVIPRHGELGPSQKSQLDLMSALSCSQHVESSLPLSTDSFSNDPILQTIPTTSSHVDVGSTVLSTLQSDCMDQLSDMESTYVWIQMEAIRKEDATICFIRCDNRTMATVVSDESLLTAPISLSRCKPETLNNKLHVFTSHSSHPVADGVILGTDTVTQHINYPHPSQHLAWRHSDHRKSNPVSRIVFQSFTLLVSTVSILGAYFCPKGYIISKKYFLAQMGDGSSYLQRYSSYAKRRLTAAVGVGAMTQIEVVSTSVASGASVYVSSAIKAVAIFTLRIATLCRRIMGDEFFQVVVSMIPRQVSVKIAQ
ncbi:hypothetical protein O5D80_007839 [Batrachochytrium dendrobatidis]|nr:hypothetical protein O5D80_007839 [Batrachochytrium dendrobatidis]